MSVVLPEVPAVITVVGDNVEDVYQLSQESFLDSAKIVPFVEKNEKFMMRPIHDPAQKYIQTNKNGETSFYYMWVSAVKENSNNPDYMLAIEFRRRPPDKNGNTVFSPEAMLRGRFANAIVFGGMACCGSIQGHWTQVLGDGKMVDKALSPPSSLVEAEHDKWLKGKVYLADTQESRGQLAHLYLHILSKRSPEKFKHDCSNYADYADLRSSGRALTPS